MEKGLVQAERNCPSLCSKQTSVCVCIPPGGWSGCAGLGAVALVCVCVSHLVGEWLCWSGSCCPGMCVSVCVCVSPGGGVAVPGWELLPWCVCVCVCVCVSPGGEVAVPG